MKTEVATKKSVVKTIVLQPLNDFAIADANFLKDSLQKFYSINVKIAETKKVIETAFYKPRDRWRADSIIAWLKFLNNDSVRTTVGLINDDISTTKGNISDYGVMGLGYHPGKSCVISTFRIKKGILKRELLLQRLFKVVAHEMGHNFGLPHCENQNCMMVDAEGKMKLDSEKNLCDKCKQQIKI